MIEKMTKQQLIEELTMIELMGYLSFKSGRRPYQLVGELAESRMRLLVAVDELEAENERLRWRISKLTKTTNP